MTGKGDCSEDEEHKREHQSSKPGKGECSEEEHKREQQSSMPGKGECSEEYTPSQFEGLLELIDKKFANGDLMDAMSLADIVDESYPSSETKRAKTATYILHWIAAAADRGETTLGRTSAKTYLFHRIRTEADRKELCDQLRPDKSRRDSTVAAAAYEALIQYIRRPSSYCYPFYDRRWKRFGGY